MDLVRRDEKVIPATLTGNICLNLASRTKIRIQTKIPDGEWTDQLAEQVPDDESWCFNIVISGTVE